MVSLMVFMGCLGVLLAVDYYMGYAGRWFRSYALYMKVNIALMVAAAFSLDRSLVGMQRPVLYSAFLAVALLDTLWCAYIGHRSGEGR